MTKRESSPQLTSFASTSAPAANSAPTTSACPNKAAKSRGVDPSCENSPWQKVQHHENTMPARLWCAENRAPSSATHTHWM